MIRNSALLLFLSLSLTGLSQTVIPQRDVRTSDGVVLLMSDYLKLQKPLIISFWATYCSPCLEEFDAVAELYSDWKKEIDFEFIAVSIDDSRSAAKVKSLVAGRRWPFIVLIDQNQDIKRAMNVTSIPFYFVFDKNGKYVYKHSGYLPGDEYIMLRELKKIAFE